MRRGQRHNRDLHAGELPAVGLAVGHRHQADVDRSVPGGTTLKNVATVTTTSPQPGGNPDPATSTVDVVAKSDLAVVKTHNGARGPSAGPEPGTFES